MSLVAFDYQACDQVAGIVRNGWPDCSGMGGRIAPEYASSAGESSAHYNLAVTSAVMGNYEKAIASIERAIALDPKGMYINMLAQFRMEAEEARILEEQWK